MKNLHVIEENKKISGVCMGLAEYTNFNVTYIRALFIILLLIWGISAIVYIIILMIAPKKNNIDYTLYTQNRQVYYKDTDNKKFLGVCSGLSKEFKIDVTIIRLGVIVLSLIYIGLILYIAAAVVMEDEKK